MKLWNLFGFNRTTEVDSKLTALEQRLVEVEETNDRRHPEALTALMQAQSNTWVDPDPDMIKVYKNDSVVFKPCRQCGQFGQETEKKSRTPV